MAALVLFETGSGPIAHGAWLIVHLGTLTALVLDVAALETTITMFRAGWRPSPAHAAAVIGVIGATGILLVEAAYIGVFAPLVTASNAGHDLHWDGWPGEPSLGGGP